MRDAVSEEDVRSARQLHGRRYLDAGYVTELADDGVIDDDWVAHSKYLVAVEDSSNEIIGTCRMIQPSVRGFPLFRYLPVSEDANRTFADMNPNRCTEVSALATARTGLQEFAVGASLYAAVWQTAVAEGYAYLLAGIDRRLFRLLYRQLGFPYEPLGEPVEYMGSLTIPTALYLPKAIHDFREKWPEALAIYSGEFSFDELGHVEVDLRSEVAEYTPPQDLLDSAFARRTATTSTG